MTLVAVALLLPWVAGVALVVLDGRRRPVGWLAIAAIAATLGGLIAVGVAVAGGTGDGRIVFTTGGWPHGVGITFRADPLGVLFAILSVGTLLAAATHEVLDGVREREFPGIVVLLAAGLTGVFLTADLFNFYVFFELALAASYVLSVYGRTPRAMGAGLVFTTVNVVGTFVFLLSVAGIYRVTGTLDMAAIGERMGAADANASILIAVGFFVAFGVKLGLFPFHFWLPTAYTGAHPVVAAILSGALANIGAYGLLRFGAGLLPQTLALGATVILAIGCASILYGGLLAVSRPDTAETLAYSAIGQVGYVLVGLGVGGSVGLGAAVLYAVLNSLNKTLLFLAVGRRGALVSAAFALGAFSVAGVPPAAGFLGKLTLISTGIAVGSPALVTVLVAGSVLSFVYMFQTYQRDFWRPARPTGPTSWRLQALPALLAGLVLAAGVWPEPLLALSRDAAAVLLAGGGRP
jgi:multicomponent Na+:H+ antiporter subunit D